MAPQARVGELTVERKPRPMHHPHRVASLVEQPPLTLSVAGHSGPDHVWRHEIVQILHVCVGVVEAEVEEPLVCKQLARDRPRKLRELPKATA